MLKNQEQSFVPNHKNLETKVFIQPQNFGPYAQRYISYHTLAWGLI